MAHTLITCVLLLRYSLGTNLKWVIVRVAAASYVTLAATLPMVLMVMIVKVE